MAVPTEVSRFWTTGGAGDGSATYTRDQLAEAFRAMFCGDPTTQGVFSGLAVSGVASPMTLAVGQACVYGFLYFCTVAGDVTKSTPAVNTTGFRVVLRAGWAAQTVRVTVISNTDGVAAIPAVTQTASTTWDITLATGTITTGGVITLTDARQFCNGGPSMAALSVYGRSANSIGVADEIVAANDGEVLRRSGTSIGFGKIVAANITAGTITTTEVGSETLTPANIANRTRTLFVPAHPYQTATTPYDQWGVQLDDNESQSANGNFAVPSDFVSSMTVSAVVVASGTGNLRWDIEIDYGANGETKATHTADTALAQTAVVTNMRTVLPSVSMSSAAAGDYASIHLFRDGGSPSDTVGDVIFVSGFLVTYTADC